MNTIFLSPLPWDLFPLYIHFFSHLHRTLVLHLGVHLSTSHIRSLLQSAASGCGWGCTVQVSSPHKCGQESCCSALNAVVTALFERYFLISTQLGVPKTQHLQGNLQRTYLIKLRVDPLDRIPSDRPDSLRTQHLSLIGCTLTRMAKRWYF